MINGVATNVHFDFSSQMQEKHMAVISTSNCSDICYSGDYSAASSIVSLSNERLCRICRESEGEDDLFSHCQCRGSVGLTHTSCLVYWIKKSGSVSCELCKQKYVTIGHTNKKFWQWKLPRVGMKGWFKLIFFMVFLSTLAAFTAWIIWSRTSSSTEAKEERARKQVEYSYIVYGLLVLIAFVGMYALNIRPMARFLGRCLVINRTVAVIPNGELCKEKTSSMEALDQLEKGKLDESKNRCSCEHDLPLLKDSYVQMVDGTNYEVHGYTKFAGGNDINTCLV